MERLFRKLATLTSSVVGSPFSFITAVVIILSWAITGPLFRFSDTWQLFINTGTTIVTFLIVFLIQNTQNRDSRAMQLKLDELLRGVKGARTSMVNIEELSDQELAELQLEFRALHEKYAQALQTRTAKKNTTKAS